MDHLFLIHPDACLYYALLFIEKIASYLFYLYLSSVSNGIFLENQQRVDIFLNPGGCGFLVLKVSLVDALFRYAGPSFMKDN
jgi:hypothetical protein